LASGRPGAWLAERVWEPQLPSALASAQVSYSWWMITIFFPQDSKPQELFGAYVAEDRGKACVVSRAKSTAVSFALWKSGRRHRVFEDAAATHPDGVRQWATTWRSSGAGPARSTIATATTGSRFLYCAGRKCGLAQLDDARLVYRSARAAGARGICQRARIRKMTEWAFPTPVRQRYQEVLKEFAKRPEVASFLRGGSWRDFSAIRGIEFAAQENAARSDASGGGSGAKKRSEADGRDCKAHDLAFYAGSVMMRTGTACLAGCNAPHLRTALWKNLNSCGAACGPERSGRTGFARGMLDYDADGANELLFTSLECQALLKPSDGGTLAALDFPPASATLINSMQRRQEAYHARLVDAQHYRRERLLRFTSRRG